ncbi:MAG: methyl-accepting chemotaxis protein, partial [Syntrophales bacterium]|nr:methyl-accepting chemotaxis protein [Syntrophales bacterium]
YWAAQTFLLLATKICPAVGAIALLYVLHFLIVTHRVCGPLVSFRHTFRRIGRGDLTRRIVLRQGDYLGEVCGEINSMVENLKTMIIEINNVHARLAAHTAFLDAGADQESLAMIRRDIEEMGQVLNRFQLVPQQESSSKEK